MLALTISLNPRPYPPDAGRTIVASRCRWWSDDHGYIVGRLTTARYLTAGLRRVLLVKQQAQSTVHIAVLSSHSGHFSRRTAQYGTREGNPAGNRQGLSVTYCSVPSMKASMSFVMLCEVSTSAVDGRQLQFWISRLLPAANRMNRSAPIDDAVVQHLAWTKRTQTASVAASSSASNSGR